MKIMLYEDILEACRYDTETLYLVISTILSNDSLKEKINKELIIDAIFYLYSNNKLTIWKKMIDKDKEYNRIVDDLNKDILIDYFNKNYPFSNDDLKFATDEYFLKSNE